MNISIRLNYLVIGVLTLIVSLAGRIFASSGMDWYYTLQLPSFTPPSWIFPIVWTVIFVMTASAAILVWNRFERDMRFWLIMGLFAINALLNVLWSYLFFNRHAIGLAFVDAVLLFVTVLLLIVLIGQRSLLVASLCAPYLGWLSFALVLNLTVWLMN